MKKKKWIDPDKLILDFMSSEFEVQKLNPYCLRVSSEFSPDIMDWYFTTGTVIKNQWTKMGKFHSVGDVIDLFQL